MEGPSLRIAAEELQPFIGTSVVSVEGNTKVGKEVLLHEKVKDIFSWGKHLVFQFEHYSLRIHFLLFGSYRAEIEGQKTEGDYKKPEKMNPRLVLFFPNGFIKMYNCSVKLVQETDIKKQYDFTTDIMSKVWNSNSAFEKVMKYPNEEIADVLLDQTIFSGVGNIIKNEVLFLTKVQPQSKVKDINEEKLKELIFQAQDFSQKFYEWRKKFELKKHYQVYRQSACKVCGTKVIRGKTGKRERMSFYCPQCQQLYSPIHSTN